MSVDAKLFVTCGKDKLFDVMESVIEHMNIYVRAELDHYCKNHTDASSRFHFLLNKDYFEQSKNFTNGVRIGCHDFRCICIDFGNGDGRRSLRVFPDCSCDYLDIYDGDKIIFSIGHWGNCDAIMQVVALAVKEFGDVYYDHNDCDEHDFVKMN